MTDAPANEIKFRLGDEEIQTLYVEREYDDGVVLGWCPERKKTLWVDPANIVERAEA